MTTTVQLDIPLLLPDVADDQDECVARLVTMLTGQTGVERVHVAHAIGDTIVEHEIGEHPDGVPHTPGALCLHYDPDLISLRQVTDVALLSGVMISRRYAHEVIPFRAIGAEDDGARIEAALMALPGVTAAVVNFPGQTARVEYDVTRVNRTTVVACLIETGAVPTDSPVSVTQPGARTATVTRRWYVRNRELAWSLIAGGFLLAGWLSGRTAVEQPPLTLALYVAACVFGAGDLIGHLIKDLRRRRFRFNIDLLMVVAAIGAAVLGAWVEGALLLFLFSFGHALEHYALGRARGAIKALADLAPQSATIRRNGVDSIVPIEHVRAGDIAVVKPGQRVAVDGVVREGRSAVNQAPITGESVPVDKSPADQVFAGSVNGEGVLVIDVTAAVGDRTLDRVIKLVAEAQTQKAPTQQFTDRFERIFVPLVLIVDVLVIVGPPLAGFWSWSESFYRGMALLVAASPCALALGTPAAVLAGIAQAARNGVLIKGGAHLEALGTIDVFALDKTGTITRGEPEVTDLAPAAGVDANAPLATAAAVERQSHHPLARAIVRAADRRSLATATADDVRSVTGRGIRARLGDAFIEVGSLALFDDANVNAPQEIRASVERLERARRTTMVVRAVNRSPEWLGVIGVADDARAGVRETLNALRVTGVRRIVMLTGDNIGVAAAVANVAGLDEVRAGLMPEDKVTAIRDLASHGLVAMVGDGVNDAPALAHATVGIAMGGAGTAAALETADIVLMGDDLARLPFAVGLSRRARSIIRQNLFVSLGVIGVLVLGTITGIARIGPAVIAHEGSTLIVIANALRLLRYKGKPDPA